MKQPKILLVDDVDFFIDVERRFLRQTPAEILTAGSGAEALDIARCERPALIYLDSQMPGMDGLDCLRQLKGDTRTSTIPVVMVLSEGQQQAESAYRESGADGVLSKPLDRNAFLDLGRRFLYDIDRRAPRIPCQALVTLRHKGVEVHCTSEDLSASGAYLNCRQPAQAGDVVELSMVLPGGAAAVFTCRARVAWVNQGFPRQRLKLPQGFGVEFYKPAPEMKTALRSFLASCGAKCEAPL